MMDHSAVKIVFDTLECAAQARENFKMPLQNIVPTGRNDKHI
jgi:hypothetical protein